MLDPLIKTIEVPCNQQIAFDIFVSEMGAWWPLEKFSISAMEELDAMTLNVQAGPGGKITEIAPDGTERIWGTIKSYQPADSFSMDFHIPTPGEEVISRSQVEVQFTKLDKDTTRVTLTQSNWQAFGDRAERLREGYSDGWDDILEHAYKANIHCLSNSIEERGALKTAGIPLWVSVFALLVFVLGTCVGVIAIFGHGQDINPLMNVSWGGRQLGLALATGLAVYLKSSSAYLTAFIAGLARDVTDLITELTVNDPNLGMLSVFVGLIIFGVIGVVYAYAARHRRFC